MGKIPYLTEILWVVAPICCGVALYMVFRGVDTLRRMDAGEVE